jgi:drug/metabolite transporter, DME family
MTYRTGVGLVIAAGLMWSLMILGMRPLTDVSTWSVLAWRSAGMVPVLALFIWWRSGSLAVAFRGMGWPLVLGSGALALCFACAVFAIQNTSAANAVFPLAVTPLVSALLARVWLGEAIRPATWAAIVLAIAGVGVMVGEGLSAGQLPGNLAALGSAVFFAVFTVALRWAGARDNLPGVMLGGVFSCLLGLAGVWATGSDLFYGAGLVPLTLALGAVILGVGLSLFALGARMVPAVELSLLSMLEILLSPVWVWLVLGQTSSAMTFFGGGIVVVAIVINALGGRTAAPVPVARTVR